MKPTIFCTFCTNTCIDDLNVFLKSLSIHHAKSKVYLFLDTLTSNHVRNLHLDLELDITINLDEFTHKTRAGMEHSGVWTSFQMIKSNLIEHVLTKEDNVLYLDSDIIIVNPIDIPVDSSTELVLSPHYIKHTDVQLYGYFNGGFIWTSNKEFPNKWREFTKSSRFFDQASLENCAKYFTTRHVAENYNIAEWRIWQSDESADKMIQYLSADSTNIYFKGQPIIFFHHHFHRDSNNRFNKVVTTILSACESKRELLELLI